MYPRPLFQFQTFSKLSLFESVTIDILHLIQLVVVMRFRVVWMGGLVVRFEVNTSSTLDIWILTSQGVFLWDCNRLWRWHCFCWNIVLGSDTLPIRLEQLYSINLFTTAHYVCLVHRLQEVRALEKEWIHDSGLPTPCLDRVYNELTCFNRCWARNNRFRSFGLVEHNLGRILSVGISCHSIYFGLSVKLNVFTPLTYLVSWIPFGWSGNIQIVL